MLQQRDVSRAFAVLLASLIAVVVGPASVWGHGSEHNPTRGAFMMQGLPEGYSGLLNPLQAAEEALVEGQHLYQENCAVCHGATGAGDGPAAAGLEPPPPGINEMYGAPMEGMAVSGEASHLMHGVEHHHPGLTHAEAMGGMNLDAYMFWAISDGGAAFDSAMPAFKDILDEDERWKILLYMANGFSIAEPE